MPAFRATGLTGGAWSSCLRPAGWSGLVITKTGFWSFSISACRIGTANSAVPKNTMLAFAAIGRLVGGGYRLAPVSNQDTVGVVHLMLDHPGEQPLGAEPQRLALGVERLNLNPHRALNLRISIRDTQAALFSGFFFPRVRGDGRIEQRQRPVFGGDQHQTHQLADLDRRQSDTLVLLHGFFNI